jgi:hypothetical protein
MSDIENGQKWRHRRRGSIYEIVDSDASIQVASLGSELEDQLEGEIWIAYRPVNGHKLFFRMREEFLDGRFEQVDF